VEYLNKKTKKISIIVAGILLPFLLGYGLLNLISYIEQGEFRKYKEGITIEIKNSSNELISNINFNFGFQENTELQEIGFINRVEPGKTYELHTTNSITEKVTDLSMYMSYELKNGDKKVESISYLYYKQPKKVVVIIDIERKDEKGNLNFNAKGYNGSTPYEIE